VLDDTIVIARLTVGTKTDLDYEDNGEIISPNSVFLISKKSYIVPSFLDFAPYPGRKSLWVRPTIFENNVIISTREFAKKGQLNKTLERIISQVKKYKNEKWKLSNQATILMCAMAERICQTQDFSTIPTDIDLPAFDKPTTNWDSEMIHWCWNEAVSITDNSNIDLAM
jgi:hypothetical protein